MSKLEMPEFARIAVDAAIRNNTDCLEGVLVVGRKCSPTHGDIF